MRKKLLPIACLLLVTFSGRTAQYDVSLQPGVWTAIANHLDNGSGNTLEMVLSALPNNSQFVKWNCAGQNFYTCARSPMGWLCADTLAPGEAAFVKSPIAVTITFTGTPVTPVLPPPDLCDCDTYSFLSCQTTNPGTFETIIGMPPVEGAKVFRWSPSTTAPGMPPDAPAYSVYTYSGGAWTAPNGTPVLNLGESAFFYVPCTNPCLVTNVILNTGYDHPQGAVYPIGVDDYFWTVVADPDSATYEPRQATTIAKYPSWSDPQAGTRWISSYPTAEDERNGAYDYQTQFCLETNYTNVVLNLCLRADDWAEVFLNGATILQAGDATHGVFNTAQPICVTVDSTAHPELFHSTPSQNYLLVRVHNEYKVAMGLNLSGTVSGEGLVLDDPVCCKPGASLSGRKFNDLNGNGAWDAGEPALSGWVIQLSDGQTAVTDGNGYYYFNVTNPVPGTYTVSEQSQVGWTQTAPSNGFYSVTLTNAQSTNNLNFGNHSSLASYTIGFTNCCPRLIANQLDKPGGNTLNNIMPVLPCDAVLYKYDNASALWIVSTYSVGRGWANGDSITLNPGEGAYLYPCCTNDFDFELTFTGLPHTPGTNFVGTCSLLSRQTNDIGTYENIIGAPPEDGAAVWKWACSGFKYYVYSQDFGWMDGSSGDPVSDPTAAVGESMWISPSGSAPPQNMPQVPCPDDRSFPCDTNWDFNVPIIGGPCGGETLVVSVLSTVTNHAPCPLVLTRTWDITDLCGNRIYSSQRLTIFDDEPPIIQCASNSIQCTNTWHFQEPTASDPCCTNVTVSLVSSNCVTVDSCHSIWTGIWAAMDCCSNISTCTQTVMVVESRPTTIYCPGSISLTSCVPVLVTYSVTASNDCCTNVTIICTPPSGSQFLPGTSSNVQCLAYDECCSNVDTCTFTVTVVKPAFELLCATNKIVTGCRCSACVLGTNQAPETVIAHFTGTGGSTPGSTPTASLIIASDGKLYGTTWDGGGNGKGTVFRANTDGTGYNVLHHFSGGDEGEYPHCRLLEGDDGMLYGTTAFGGTGSYGTVFRMNKDGTGFTTLRHFNTGTSSGFNPYSGLIRGADGWLYGVTYRGGTGGDGTVYKLNPGAAGPGYGYTIIHNFSATDGHGYGPYDEPGLVQASDGTIYGTTYNGGTNEAGTIFKLQPDGTGFDVLHYFPASSTDGKHPIGKLMIGSDGALYGTTTEGGVLGRGAIFRLDPTDPFGAHSYSILHDSGSVPSDGTNLVAGLEQDCCGALYGVAYGGGSHGVGTVFRLNADGSDYDTLYHFGSHASDGAQPFANVLIDFGGMIYGTTRTGGSNNLGTLYRLNCGWGFDPPTVDEGCCTNYTLQILNTVTSSICPLAYTRTWQAIDCDSNALVCSQTVTIVGTNPPAIQCPSNIVVQSCTNIAVEYSPVATSGCCSNLMVACDPPSGSLFPPSSTTLVSCEVTDCCGNCTNCSFTVTVQPPQISAKRVGNTVVIEWAGGGTLLEATSLAGPWTPVAGGGSPWVVSLPVSGTKFYRVRCD